MHSLAAFTPAITNPTTKTSVLLQQDDSKQNNRLVLLRYEYLELINQIAQEADKKIRYCAAKLLDYFCHWRNWKLKEHRTGWIYQPLRRIYKDLLEEHSLHCIREAIALLMRAGLLERRNNPGNGQDRTYQYKLLLEQPETRTASPFVRSESPTFRSESPTFNVEQYHSFQSIESIPTHSEKKESEEETGQEEEEICVLPDTTSLTSDEDLWEENTSHKDLGEGKFSGAAPKRKKNPAEAIQEMLENHVFVQWWVSRVQKTKFSEELEMPPEAYVKARIRKQPEQALDMFGAFQNEISRRVDNFQLRLSHGCKISADEQEQIKAIAPGSIPELPPVAPPNASNAGAYQIYKPAQIEVAPPPRKNLLQEAIAKIGKPMPLSQKRPAASLEQMNRDISDPILRDEVVRKVMQSDCYTIDFDEDGMPYQVRKL